METKWEKTLGIVLMILGILLFIGGCIEAGCRGDYRWIIYGALIGLNISIIGFMCDHWGWSKKAKPGVDMTSTIILVILFAPCLLYCLYSHDFYIWGSNMRFFSICMLAIQLFHGIVLVLKARKKTENIE